MIDPIQFGTFAGQAAGTANKAIKIAKGLIDYAIKEIRTYGYRKAIQRNVKKTKIFLTIVRVYNSGLHIKNQTEDINDMNEEIMNWANSMKQKRFKQ